MENAQLTEVELNHKGNTSDDEQPPKKIIKYENQDDNNTSSQNKSPTNTNTNTTMPKEEEKVTEIKIEEKKENKSEEIKELVVESSGTTESEDPLKMPPHGTEIYIGGIPKTASNAQIQKFCEEYGEVFSLRIQKDPGTPGENRGYAFVTFKEPEQASSAVDSMNNQSFPNFPDKTLKVILSQVKNRLFIGNIPKNLSVDELRANLNSEVRGIIDVELLKDSESQNMNRGFCFVEFYNHAAAELSRKILSRPDFKLHGRVLTVTWAEPKKLDTQLEEVKSIYVSNLPDTITEQKMKDLFKGYGKINKVVLILSRDRERYREYGFIHYEERAYALKAVEAAEKEKPIIDGNELIVAMAKPPRLDEDRGYYHGKRSYYGNRHSYPYNSKSYRSSTGLSSSYSRYYDSYNSLNSRTADAHYREIDYDHAFSAYNTTSTVQIPGMALVPVYMQNGQLAFMFQQQGVTQSTASAGDTQALYSAKATVNPSRTKPTSPMSNPNSRSNQYASLASYNRSNTATDTRGHSSKSRHEHRHSSSSRQRNANGTSSSNYRSNSGGPSRSGGGGGGGGSSSRYRDSGRYRPY